MGEGSTQSLIVVPPTPCLYPSVYHKGRCLVLTLFSLFTNDLPSSVTSSSVYLYVDDTTIYCIKRTQDEAVAQLNKALNVLYDWCLINRLTPYPEKSEAMLSSKTRAIGPLAPIQMGTDTIK